MNSVPAFVVFQNAGISPVLEWGTVLDSQPVEFAGVNSLPGENSQCPPGKPEPGGSPDITTLPWLEMMQLLKSFCSCGQGLSAFAQGKGN